MVQNHRGLIEDFRQKNAEFTKKTVKTESNPCQSFQSLEDVEKVISSTEIDFFVIFFYNNYLFLKICVQLRHVAKEVEEKKTRSASILEKKEIFQRQKKQILVDLRLWKQNRPFISADFTNNTIIYNLLPIG